MIYYKTKPKIKIKEIILSEVDSMDINMEIVFDMLEDEDFAELTLPEALEVLEFINEED